MEGRQTGRAVLADTVGADLSHGEKKLVALASVMAMDPEVLILDEPTAGLDHVTKSRLMEILEGLKLTLVIASHEMDFLSRMATIFYSLSDGHIRAAQDVAAHTHTHIHVGGAAVHRHDEEIP